MKNATLKDIAKAAGVSAMSVSKALNNKPGISEETRKRILRVAEELHYTQNMVAKSLRTEETMTIGVVLSDSSEMVTSRILWGIHDMAKEHHYSVIIANTDRSEETEKEAVETLINKRIDGLIMVAPIRNSTDYMTWLQNFGIPLVLLMRQNQKQSVDTVINDNFLGGYQIVEHLTRQKCRNFAFLPLLNSQSGTERIAGYSQALRQLKIDYDDCPALLTAPFINDGYQNMKKLLESGVNFDALVCGCDTIAIGAMSALLEAGISIPKDVCVTGYDGIELASYLMVPLTTIVQPLYEMGQQGTEILLDRIKYPSIPVRKIILKSELLVQGSTKRTVK